MKKFFKLNILLLLIIFYSCDKEELLEDSVDTINIETKNIDNNSKAYTPIPDSDSYFDPDPDEVENRKEWLGFLIGQTLIESSNSYYSVEQEFINTLHNNAIDDDITIDQLFSNSVFENEFRIQFARFHNARSNPFNSCSPYLDGGKSKPQSVPDETIPPGANGGNDNDITISDELFAKYLIKMRHYEIYVPNNYRVRFSTIKSAADTASGNNEGYLHRSECDVNTTTVNNWTSGNVIIVRSITDAW